MQKLPKTKLKIQIPKKLTKGSVVDLVAPSFAFDKTLFESGIYTIQKNLGLLPRFRKDIFSQEMYFAGSDERRLEELFEALTASDSEAVFVIRGGYGTAHLYTSLIKKLKKVKNLKPKIVLGYSDFTLILNGLHQELGWQTFHGPMVCGRPFREPNALETKTLMRCLFEKKPLGKIQTEKMRSFSQGTASGKIVGGNLTLVTNTIGTPHPLDTKNNILFLEDTDERPYRVERMLVHLLQAGMLDEVRGIVFGEMANCVPPMPKSGVYPHPTENITVEMAILKALAPLLKKRKIPIIFDFPSGHGGNQITFPIGGMVTLNAGKRPWVEFK